MMLLSLIFRLEIPGSTAKILRVTEMSYAPSLRSIVTVVMHRQVFTFFPG
jgi:hypothetical protein